MRWTCPKCGKKLEISNEQLLAQDGVIVCPQCLQQAQQPLPRVRLRAKEEVSQSSGSATPPPHRQRASSSATTSSGSRPPAYHARTNSGTSSNVNTGRSTRSSGSKKKRKQKRKSRGMSAWGCLWRSVAITLLLMAAYVFVGMLLQTIT